MIQILFKDETGTYKKELVKLFFGTIENLINDLKIEHEIILDNLYKFEFDDIYLKCKMVVRGNIIHWENDDFPIDVSRNNANYLDSKLFECQPGDICDTMASNGWLSLLQYAHKHHCKWNSLTCAHAAKSGHLDCLKYLHEHGCKWDKSTCHEATRNGHLDCLKYAYENGCEWDSENMCYFAAEYDRLECLKYAYKNGCKIGKREFIVAINIYYHSDCFIYIAKHITENREKYMKILCDTVDLEFYNPDWGETKLEYVKDLYEVGYEFNEKVCATFARFDDIECLEYARDIGCPWDCAVPMKAAKYESINCLAYAYRNGCEWSTAIRRIARDNNCVACIEFCEKNNC